MRMTSAVRARLAEEIAGAGGREVCFAGQLDPQGVVVDVRAVARGTPDCVLALPGSAARGEMVIHNHPSGVLEPSAADLDIGVRLHDAGLGLGIIDNAAASLYVVVEVPRAPEYTPLDPVGTAAMLGASGAVAKTLTQFEDRPSQQDMASYVADLYNEGGVALLEAGTGIGKSFAYLVAAALWARENGERTVVSTNTINLQEQLIGKDLPLLRRALSGDGEELTYALLKGWRNYVCLSRLELARGGAGSLLAPGKHEEIEQIAEWASHTTDGSLADLVDEPSPEIWDEISAEPDLCTRLKCPHFDRCFLFGARRRAAQADVIVVNHHLLAADLSVRRAQDNWTDAAVLPPYRRLILDEGHHLEDTAAQHLGAHVTSRGVTRLLSRLERNGKGLLPTLLRDLAQRDELLSQASLDLIRLALMPAIADARAHSDRVFGVLADRLQSVGETVLRLTNAFAADPVWGAGLGEALDNMVAVFRRIGDGVETVADRLEQEEGSERASQLIQELRGVVRRLHTAADSVLLALRPEQPAATVRWIERRGSRPAGALPFPIALAAVPLDLAPILRESLFDRIDTVVLTSATLAAGGDFRFLKERVGLAEPVGRVKYEYILPSPFDYPKQCLLGIPTDLPEPRRDEAGHEAALAAAVSDVARASDGGLFVLFTSHAALRRVAAAVRADVGSRWPLLVQGEGQRDQLLRRFRDSGSAVLLGTDSFWEGVDVPGASLRSLVIAKLPFKVPTEPLTAARLERVEEQGMDGFMNYLLPHAALKLKQGFGRLIRSSSDVGVVVVMDHRIVTRGYGRTLTASLPPADTIVGTWAEVRGAVQDFFARHARGVMACSPETSG